eukprot:8172571-Pyramimonas_sp.AAC.1
MCIRDRLGGRLASEAAERSVEFPRRARVAPRRPLRRARVVRGAGPTVERRRGSGGRCPGQASRINSVSPSSLARAVASL